MSMCRVFSCLVRGGCLLWPCVLLEKLLLSFALLHSVRQGQICCYSRCFLIFYFCTPVPYNEKDIFFWVLVLQGLGDLHRTIQLQLLQHYWWGHLLGLPCIEWFALEMTEIILSFLRLHPSTSFPTLLLNVMATPFLLRDSCPLILKKKTFRSS